MAIAEMKKLNLIAMAYDKDKILNALSSTGAVEVTAHSPRQDLLPIPEDDEKARGQLATAEAALDILTAAVAEYESAKKIKSDTLKDGFDVPYLQFMSAKGKQADADKLIARINELADRRNALTAQIQSEHKTLDTASIYSHLNAPFKLFSGSAHTQVKLGTVPATEVATLKAAFEEIKLSDIDILDESADNVLLYAVWHNDVSAQAEAALTAATFSSCPFEGNISGYEVYKDSEQKINSLYATLSQCINELYELKDNVKPLKVYCDYLAFELEKAELNGKMLSTERTFWLEAYVPAQEVERVNEKITSVCDSVYCNFYDVPEDENPPTLMRNKPLVSSFESITNMYSPPNYREFDPTIIMGLFYSLFLGFIMADIGYGLIMLIGGGAIYLKTKSRDSGFHRLAGVFAIGGACAIIWGLLFNSLFGVSLAFMPTVMPNAQSDMWSLAGINVPAVLIISLIIGTVQLMVGYICKAVQCWRRGQIWDGICEGVTWAVFSLGVILVIVGFTDQSNASFLTPIGGIMAAVGLVAAMLTAGRHEKVLGKLTKGFGAAYGVINYASDILSYARLYGLMLSGAVIAQIVSQYGIQFIVSGNVALIILGVIIMAVGHVFNLAISLLGAYIHDARLQYVEFYGKFYEGEGELFAPLGSAHKYIYVTHE